MCYFLETPLFALGGQSKRLTKYLVFHHGTYPLIIWSAAVYAPGGNSLFLGVINLFIHVIHFTYLSITTSFPKFKLFFYPKFFFLAHIVQFSAVILHGAQFYLDNFCNYPLFIVNIAEFWGVLIFLLFVSDWFSFISPKEESKKYSKIQELQAYSI